MPSSSVGPAIVAAGLVLVIVGVLVCLGGLSWFGRLPGDIRIERETVHVYIPLVSMLVISLVFTLILNLISRFF
jgi:DUF2905 family protein